MLFSIMRERKKREFDPAVANVREALKEVSTSSSSGVALDRLRQMEQMLTALDNIANKILSSDAAATLIFSFFLNKAE